MPVETTTQANVFETLFGANWRVRISGTFMIVCGTISFYPDSIGFLPLMWIPKIVGFAKFICLATGTTFVYNAKDRQVTGGSVEQTEKGTMKLKRFVR